MSVIEKDLNPDTYIGLALPLRHGNEGFFSKTKRTIDQLKLKRHRTGTGTSLYYCKYLYFYFNYPYTGF